MTNGGIFSSKAVVAFSIISGVATGIATLYLANRFAGMKVTTGSVAFAISLSAAITLTSAFLITECIGC